MRVSVSVRAVGALVLLASLMTVPAAAAAPKYAQAEFDVAVRDFFFAPDELFVNAGDTVTWTWEGANPHNVIPLEEGAFTPSETQTTGTHEVTFEETGQVPYFCSIHSSPDGTEGMTGVVNVLAEGEPLPEPGPEPRPAPEPGVLPSAPDAIGIALVWSSLFPDGSAPTVALGRDDVFADSLTSGAVQGLVDGPLLLTPTENLDQRVIDELARLGAQTVVIFGGVNAISAEVEAQLMQLGHTVQRVEGPTRIETATDAAGTFFPEARSAFLVRSDALPGADPTQGFADSLGVGGAAARASIPILLSQTDRLSDSTRTYLQAHPDLTTIFLVGGDAALAPQVEADLTALGIDVSRLAGPTRFDTNLAVVFEFYDFPEVAILVEGQGADAWISGFSAASAAESAPILLANGDDLPAGALEPFLFGVQPLCGPGVSPVACERAQIAASSAQFGDPGVLFAVMNGGEEVPGPGQPEVTGDFVLYPTSAPDAFCYEIFAYNLGEPITGAHIHTGAAGVAGDIVIPLGEPDEEGFLASCVFDVDPAPLADILANPGDYYVNYHTESFPAGAIRGQLFEGEVIAFTELSPDDEVPPADIGGGGFFAVLTDANDHTRLAYHVSYELEDGSQAVAGHIHEGAEDENGPVVQALELPTVAGDFGFEGTFLLEGVDMGLVEALLADPGDYYVNLHTEAFPDGALRGQLFNPFSGPPPGEGPPEEPAAAAFAARRR